MSNSTPPTSDESCDPSYEENIFELGLDESGASDGSDAGEDGIDVEERGDDKENDDTLKDLPVTSPHGLSDSSEDYVVYGTTPPHSGRFEKMANKTHKYRTTKKLSPGPTAIKHKPHFTKSSLKPPKQALLRPKEKSSRGYGGKKDHHSPTHQLETSSKANRKKKKQLRKQERDSKSSLHQVSSPKLSHSHSVDVPNYTPASSSVTKRLSGSFENLSDSLQPHLLSSWRSSSVGGERPRRVQSDFSITSQALDERQYCAPERKKFYRNFLNTLKHSGISNMTRPLIDSTPLGPGVMHISRMRSENLALSNPYGELWERIWLELKAYLSNQAPDEFKEWVFYKTNHIKKVLRHVLDFRVPLVNPVMSLNSAFLGVEDEEEEEPIRSSSDKSNSSFKHVAFSSAVDIREDSTEQDELPGATEEAPAKNLDCCDSLSGESDLLQFEPRQFLSQLQVGALQMVCRLLKSLDEIEALYSSRGSMGDEYPEYRTLNFRRRLAALILWKKVTSSLASKLASLSTWLGAQVELRDVCRDLTPDPSEDKDSSLPLTDQASPEVSSILVTGPKSSSNRHAHFSFHSQSSEEEAGLGHQLSTGQSTNSTATLQRLFSNYQSVFDNHGPYREFVNRILKKKGLTYLMKSICDYIKPVLDLAQYALCPPSEPVEEESGSRPRPRIQYLMNPELLKQSGEQVDSPVQYDRSTSTGPENWIQEFEQMNLPLFTVQYIQLVHVPLDIMHECIRLQLELKPPQQPSLHSVRRLVRECRETLEQAIEIRLFYRERIELVTRNNPSKLTQVETDIETFEADLKCVLEVYFDYLQSWAQVSSGHILEEEWSHVKEICAKIRGGEAEGGQRFCDMASHLLETTGDKLEAGMDECYSILHKFEDNSEERRVAIVESCRSFKELFVDIRERASKALGFAKMLRKDLEIAADFSILTSTPQLLQALQASDHVQVKLSNEKLDKMLFVSESVSNAPDEICQLLNVSFAPGESDKTHYESYLLLVNLDVAESQSSWNGRTVEISTSAETTSAISEVQVESLKMVVSNSASLSSCRNSFLNAVGSAVRLTNEQTSSHENVTERIADLKMAASSLASHIMSMALKVMEHLGIEDTSHGEDLSKPYQATMHSCFNLGFEYVREVFRLLGDDLAYSNLGAEALEYAVLWIRFVLNKCERGRGTRPRWASTGLEFMTVACAPRTLAIISQTKFESLKKLMDRCVDHVVGEAPSPMVRKDKLVQSAVRHRKPWRSTRAPPLATRAFSESTVLEMIPQMDEEVVAKVQHYPQLDPSALCVAQTAMDVEQGVIRVERETIDSHYRGSEPLGAGLLHSIPVPTEPHLSGQSPPVSTESIDYSSGVESPPYMSGDIPTTLASAYNPMVTPQRSIPLPPTLSHSDSTTRTSRMYNSTLSLTRTDSGSSMMQNELERTKKIQEEVSRIDKQRELMLLNKKVIGTVKARQSSSHTDAKLGHLMVAHFKWQRGRKLGEGRFGKVYECFNMTTGEINAVKQISIQEKDSSTVQTILDEINVFQRVNHENIVKFYGVEKHHNDLYMFMEYCSEGTLWSIAQQGLSEHMIRRYTRDLVEAVYFLHDLGIVHRDIKGSNIFLSSNGSIKLGDFGLSVQLKNYHKTMPNEIKQQVGTVPYMSPEVILNQSMGRPMDIWSIGCVVVEMATGKLPWSEFENQFQIMFQLGSQKTPSVPSSALSEEGHDFLSKCFLFDPQERWKAIQLLDHPFVKVDDCEYSNEED